MEIKKMTPQSNIAILALGWLLAAFTFLGAEEANSDSTTKEHQLPEYTVELSFPILTKAIPPRLSKSQIGHKVEMEFTVTDKGNTTNIKSAEAFPVAQDLAAAMKRVIRHWEFEPARNRQGLPIAVRMTLPVRVVRDGENAEQYAAIATVNPTVAALSGK